MLIVFGSINIDIITPVPQLPRPGETVLGSDYLVVPGGKGANQAVAAALSGEHEDVRMIGTVGDDSWAPIALSELVSTGVNLKQISKGSRPTGCATIWVDEQGENAIAVSSGANLETAHHQVPEAWLAPGNLLLLQMEVPAEENWYLLGAAKRRGCTTMLNLAPAESIPTGALHDLDYLLVNEQEAQHIFEQHDELHSSLDQQLSRFCERFDLQMIVTLGGQGVVGCDQDHVWRSAALPVDVIDTTGAGDAFTGCFARAIHDGYAMAEAVEFATAGAALSCRKQGAQHSYPVRSEILDVISG